MSRPQKAKVQRVTLTLHFNKPTTRRAAAAAARDNIHGKFYPTVLRDDDPEWFRVTGAKPAVKP